MEYEEPEDEEVQMHMTYVPDDDAGYPDEDEGPINMVSLFLSLSAFVLSKDTLLTGRTPTLMMRRQQRSERRIRRAKTRLSSQRRKKRKRRI
jgi:hypothetical protein